MEIRYPERGRKQKVFSYHNSYLLKFGNKIPREGTETNIPDALPNKKSEYLEIRYPERGRKQMKEFKSTDVILNLEIRYPERGRKQLYL